MGIGTSSLKGAPIADIGSEPVKLLAPRKSSFRGQWPAEADAPAVAEQPRRDSKAPYRDPYEATAEQNYPHEKYYPGAEHARYRAEQKRNSLSRYRSGDEHAKYRAQQAQEHAKHETERKQRRADEGLSDEQTGFISSADQAVGYGQTEAAKPQGMKAKMLDKFNSNSGDGRRRMSDEEMVKYTGKTMEELRAQGRRQAAGRVPDQLSTWANVRGGGM